MTLLYAFQKSLRFYRNRLLRPVPEEDPHPSPPPYRRRTRRKRRQPSPSNLPLLLYAALVISLAATFTNTPPFHLINALFSHPHTHATNVHNQLPLEAMRPPQFGTHLANNLHANPPFFQPFDVQLNEDTHAYQPPRAHYTAPSQRTSAANHVSTPSIPRLPIPAHQHNTRTCYHSSSNHASLCVHVPLCLQPSSFIYISDTLRCAPYTTHDGNVAALSMGHCVELQRDIEASAEIEQVEHRSKTWLHKQDSKHNVMWFQGDSVFFRMTSRCRSVTHFAERIFMLHHILQHPQRYGMGAVSNVIIAADEVVAEKIRYTKSWHHGLLAAIVYPNRLVYNRKTLQKLVKIPLPDGEMNVFISSGSWSLASKEAAACFNRVAVSSALRSRFLLPEDEFPGQVNQTAKQSPARFHDAQVFRSQLFRSLKRAAVHVEKRVVYLHRPRTRTFTPDGLAMLEAKLRQVATANGFTYRLINVEGMTFPQQIDAVSSAAVVVGIHGTQMLNTLFLASGASVVELFPYRFSNSLFAGGGGAGLHYAKHQMTNGEEFPGLREFAGVEKCQRRSSNCRLWYQSDNRKLQFGILDAAAVGQYVQNAISHVKESLHTSSVNK